MTSFIIRILTLIFKILTFAYQTKSNDESTSETKTNTNKLIKLLEPTVDKEIFADINTNRSSLSQSLETLFDKLDRTSLHIRNYRANINGSILIRLEHSKNEYYFSELNIPIYLPIETYLTLVDRLLRRTLSISLTHICRIVRSSVDAVQILLDNLDYSDRETMQIEVISKTIDEVFKQLVHYVGYDTTNLAVRHFLQDFEIVLGLICYQSIYSSSKRSLVNESNYLFNGSNITGKSIDGLLNFLTDKAMRGISSMMVENSSSNNTYSLEGRFVTITSKIEFVGFDYETSDNSQGKTDNLSGMFPQIVIVETIEIVNKIANSSYTFAINYFVRAENKEWERIGEVLAGIIN